MTLPVARCQHPESGTSDNNKSVQQRAMLGIRGGIREVLASATAEMRSQEASWCWHRISSTVPKRQAGSELQASL